MRSIVLVPIVAASAASLSGSPHPEAAAAKVRGLSMPKRVAVDELKYRGVPLTVRVSRPARVLQVSIVRTGRHHARIGRRVFRLNGRRKVVVRFRVWRAPQLIGHGPYQVRVRAGRSVGRLSGRTLHRRLRIVRRRATPAPAGQAPPEPTPAPSPAPAPPTTSQPITVAAAGDFCGGSCAPVAAEVKSWSPYRFLALGDYEYDDAGSNGSAFQGGYQQTFAALHAITIPTFGSTHDTCDGSGSWECYPVSFFDANGAPEVRGKLADHQWGYSVDLPDGWHLLNLNYNATDLGQVNADLAGRSGKCVIAQMHAPVYGSPSSEHSKNEGSQFADALNAGGVDLIVNGHQHFYERNAYPEGTAFTVGTGGVGPYTRTSTAPTSQKYISGTYGALKLTLSPGHWDAQFVSTSGAVLDSASGDCAD